MISLYRLPSTLQSRAILIFVSTFFFTALLQTYIWITPNPYGDSLIWSPAAHIFARGELPDLSSPTPVHPGTSVLVPAAILLRTGLADTRAVEIVLITMIALTVSLLATITYRMRPNSLWWLGIVAFVAPDPRFFSMTPPSVAAALCTGLYIVLLVRSLEKNMSAQSAILLGIIGGVLVASRIDVGIFVMATSLYFIVQQPVRYIVLGTISTCVSLILLDPYLWFEPVVHIAGFFHQVHANISTAIPFGYGLEVTLPAVLSCAIACFVALRAPNLSSLPRQFLIWLVCVSVTLTLLLSLSQYHAMRYFLPIIVIWEVLAPLIVFDLAERSTFLATWIRRQDFELLFVVACFLARSSVVPTFLLLYVQAFSV